MTNLLQQLNGDMASVVDNVRASLVQINTGHGQGAGTIWHADGLIITNAHVVEGLPRMGRRYGYSGVRQTVSDKLEVTLPDGSTHTARLIARDAENDIAALSVDANGLPTIQLGNSRSVKAGQWVFAVGHPWGVLGAATAGIVIGSGSEWGELPQNGKDYVVVSLKVRPGNSGGPLVDTAGKLIGINTMMTGPQVGVAIPVHVVKAFLKESLGSSVTDSVASAVL